MNLAKFVREVRQEGNKVTWPTRKETTVSTAMVLMFVTITAVFFIFVDGVVNVIIRTILGF